jgi:hypothetical protein
MSEELLIRQLLTPLLLRAEFKVSSDGISRSFGLAAEPAIGKDGRIWFERI